MLCAGQWVQLLRESVDAAHSKGDGQRRSASTAPEDPDANRQRRAERATARRGPQRILLPFFLKFLLLAVASSALPQAPPRGCRGEGVAASRACSAPGLRVFVCRWRLRGRRCALGAKASQARLNKLHNTASSPPPTLPQRLQPEVLFGRWRLLGRRSWTPWPGALRFFNGLMLLPRGHKTTLGHLAQLPQEGCTRHAVVRAAAIEGRVARAA